MNGQDSSMFRKLPIIYIALAGGVLLFAAVVFVVLPSPEVSSELAILRWIWLGFALLSVLGAGVVRGRLRRDAEPQEAVTAAILIWALAEGQALLGLVTYLVAGDRLPGLLGLLVGVYVFARYRPSAFRPWFRVSAPGNAPRG